MDDDDDFDFDDEDDGEPTGSCDECESNLYRDDEYHFHGLILCGQCYWWRTRA